MTTYPDNFAVEVPLWPLGFRPIVEVLPAQIERRLGYFGQDRFVCFHYEPRGDEVMWRDSRSYGFGTGAWTTFLEHISPLADSYSVKVGGTNGAVTHVLIVDRAEQRAYFAAVDDARRFLAEQPRPQ